MNGFTSGYHAANGQQHSPRDWFTRGAYPSCSCGFTPNNNRALAEHWSANGMRWIDDHGTLRPEFDVPDNPILAAFRVEALMQREASWLKVPDLAALWLARQEMASEVTGSEWKHARRVLAKLAAVYA